MTRVREVIEADCQNRSILLPKNATFAIALNIGMIPTLSLPSLDHNLAALGVSLAFITQGKDGFV